MRRIRFRAVTILLTVIVLAAAALLNLLAVRVENRYSLKLDFSNESVTELGDQTKKLLSSLSTDVEIVTVFESATKNTLRSLLADTLSCYAGLSGRVTVRNVDPGTDPQKILALDPSGGTVYEGTVFVTADGRTVKIPAENFLYTRQIGGQDYTLFCGEIRVTGALLTLLRDEPPRALFLAGHGEDGLSSLTAARVQLEMSGFAVSELYLDETTPETGDVVIVLNPEIDLSKGEFETLVRFIDGGGKLLFAASAYMKTLPRFADLLSLYGLGFKTGYTVASTKDASSYMDSPAILRADVGAGHEITEGLSGRIALPTSCAVAEPEVRAFWRTDTLLLSAKTSLFKTDGYDRLFEFVSGDETGSQILALAAYGEASRIVLLASDQMLLDESSLAGGDLVNATENLAFFDRCVRWLAGLSDEEALADVKIVPNNLLNTPSEEVTRQIVALCLTVLPALALIGCAVSVLRRRRL